MNYKKTLILLGATFLMLPGHLLANSLANCQIGAQVSDIHYKEPGVMIERGLLAGPCGFIETRTFADIQFNAFASYVTGTLDYKSDPASGRDLRSENNGSIIDVMLGVSRRTPRLNWLEDVSMGVGYRLLTDDIADIGALKGYKREQHYYYIPIEAEFLFYDHNDWQVTGSAKYNFLILGMNSSVIADLEQHSGYGYGVSLAIHRRMEAGWLDTIVVEPFLEHWEIGKSNLSNGFFEPSNSTRTLGLRLSAQF
jgi:hypothetical protein